MMSLEIEARGEPIIQGLAHDSLWWDYRRSRPLRGTAETLRVRLNWQSLAGQYAALRHYVMTPGAISFAELNRLRYSATIATANTPNAALHLTIELLRMGRRSEAYQTVKRLQGFVPEQTGDALILYSRVALILAASGAYARAVNYFAGAIHSHMPHAAALEALTFFNQMQANAFAASQMVFVGAMPVADALTPERDAVRLPVPPISLIGSAQPGLSRIEIDALFGDPAVIDDDIALYTVETKRVQVVYAANRAVSVHVS